MTLNSEGPQGRIPHDGCTCQPKVQTAVYCPYCGEETYGDGHRVDDEIPEVFCESTLMSTPRYCMGCGAPVDEYDLSDDGRPMEVA